MLQKQTVESGGSVVQWAGFDIQMCPAAAAAAQITARP